MEEVWRTVPDYDQYSVSDFGNVRRRNRLLKFGNSGGYSMVSLSKGGVAKTMSVARLVASVFLPNDSGKPTIDHIDRVRTNNRASNLRWATYCEQMMNRDMPLGGTGQRNITSQYGRFKCQIKRGGRFVFTKMCGTLEEAMAARDEYLNPSSDNDSQSVPEAEPAPAPSSA